MRMMLAPKPTAPRHDAHVLHVIVRAEQSGSAPMAFAANVHAGFIAWRPNVKAVR